MNSEDIYYRLSVSQSVLDHLRSLESRAIVAGRAGEFVSALRTINAWLQADPASLGEPVRDYSTLRVTEYAGSYGPISVTYDIHWDSRTVFIIRPFEILRWAGF